MKLLVIIVNFRTPELSLNAVETVLADIEGVDARVTVVDNHSGDGSFDFLSREVSARCWSRVDVIASGRNGGFGFGNNVAVARALRGPDPPAVFFLLNPDASVVPGCFRVLLDFMAAHPEVGIAGPLVSHPDGTPQTSAFRFPSVLGEFERGLRFGAASRLLGRYRVAPPPPSRTTSADWVSGAALAIRRDVIEAVGPFDEGFFLYFEEIDLCRRARLAGFDVRFCPEARVRHAEGTSTGLHTNRRIPRYWFESRRRYFVKQHGAPYFVAASAAWALGHAFWRARLRLQQKPDPDPPQLMADFLKHSFVASLGAEVHRAT
jgi:GT2 family glycosyltransferase